MKSLKLFAQGFDKEVLSSHRWMACGLVMSGEIGLVTALVQWSSLNRIMCLVHIIFNALVNKTESVISVVDGGGTLDSYSHLSEM